MGVDGGWRAVERREGELEGEMMRVVAVVVVGAGLRGSNAERGVLFVGSAVEEVEGKGEWRKAGGLITCGGAASGVG